MQNSFFGGDRVASGIDFPPLDRWSFSPSHNLSGDNSAINKSKEQVVT